MLILLPLFAALGPVWLTVYLFILSWVYLGQALRIWAFLACLAMVLWTGAGFSQGVTGMKQGEGGSAVQGAAGTSGEEHYRCRNKNG